jgi:hypothetical protein
MGKGQSQAVYTNDPWSINMNNQMQQQNFHQAQIDAQRAKAMREGRAMGQEYFGHGTLPRLREGRSQEQADLLAQRYGIAGVAGNRSGDVQDVLARRRSMLGGYNSQQFDALRQRGMDQINNQVSTAQDAVRRAQGLNPRNPAAAAAQLAQIEKDAMGDVANLQRDLFIDDIDFRNQMLSNFEQSATGAEFNEWNRQMQAQSALESLQSQIANEELQREMYNNQQFQKEKAGQLQSLMGSLGLGASDYGTTAQLYLANQGMQNALNTGGGGKGGK